MDTEYCYKCGILHNPEDGECLACNLISLSNKKLQDRLDLLTDAFDRKTRVHDAVNKSYVALKRYVKELEMTEEASQQYVVKAKDDLSEMKTAFLDLYKFLTHAPFDFKNGNTHNGVDEGEVLGFKYLSEILHKHRHIWDGEK